jgi:probable addiction module antidote protein
MKRIVQAPTSVSHARKIVERLQNESRFAAEYLKAAIEEDGDPHVLLIALRRIAEARGGAAKIARLAGVERESLHRALSGRGNPRFSTLTAVAGAVGLRLTVEPI